MKKICFVISSLAGGGAEKSVLKLSEELSDLGHNVHIIILQNIIEHKIFPEKYTIHCLQQYGKLSSMTSPYNVSTPYSSANQRLVTSNCDITLSDGPESVLIRIAPETGFTCILDDSTPKKCIK